VTAWATTRSGTLGLYMALLEAHLLPKHDTQWALTQPSVASYRFRTADKVAISAMH